MSTGSWTSTGVTSGGYTRTRRTRIFKRAGEESTCRTKRSAELRRSALLARNPLPGADYDSRARRSWRRPGDGAPPAGKPTAGTTDRFSSAIQPCLAAGAANSTAAGMTRGSVQLANYRTHGQTADAFRQVAAGLPELCRRLALQRWGSPGDPGHAQHSTIPGKLDIIDAGSAEAGEVLAGREPGIGLARLRRPSTRIRSAGYPSRAATRRCCRLLACSTTKWTARLAAGGGDVAQLMLAGEVSLPVGRDLGGDHQPDLVGR